MFAGRYFSIGARDKEKQARQCLEKVLGLRKTHIAALVTLAWINLGCGGNSGNALSPFCPSALYAVSSSALIATASDRKVHQLLDAAARELNGQIDITLLMARARLQCRQGHVDSAINNLNTVLRTFPSVNFFKT